MNKKSKINIKEYFATIIVVSIAVISLCMCVELDLLFKTEKRVIETVIPKSPWMRFPGILVKKTVIPNLRINASNTKYPNAIISSAKIAANISQKNLTKA